MVEWPGVRNYGGEQDVQRGKTKAELAGLFVILLDSVFRSQRDTRLVTDLCLEKQHFCAKVVSCQADRPTRAQKQQKHSRFVIRDSRFSRLTIHKIS